MNTKPEQFENYPEANRQYHSYAIRSWNGYKWVYWGSRFYEDEGHIEQWIDEEHKCWTTTDPLSAMFKAQGLSLKTKSLVEVIIFEEPKVLKTFWYEHRLLELESIEDNNERRKDLHEQAC